MLPEDDRESPCVGETGASGDGLDVGIRLREQSSCVRETLTGDLLVDASFQCAPKASFKGAPRTAGRFRDVVNGNRLVIMSPDEGDRGMDRGVAGGDEIGGLSLDDLDRRQEVPRMKRLLPVHQPAQGAGRLPSDLVGGYLDAGVGTHFR